MFSEHPRTSPHSFVAAIDLTNAQSDGHLAALTNDLSQSGCSVKTGTPFPKCTRVMLRICHAGMNFFAEGKVLIRRPTWEWESSSPRLRRVAITFWTDGLRS